MFAARNAIFTKSGKTPVGFLTISTAQSSNVSFSYTVPSDASVLVVVGTSRSTTAGSATVDSVAMTKSVSYSNTDIIEIYTQLNPSPGSRTINVATGSSASGIFAMTFSNCASIGSTYTANTTDGQIAFSSAANSRNIYVVARRTSTGTGFTVSPAEYTSRASQIGTLNFNIGDIPTGGTVSVSGLTANVAAGLQLLA
jgi:hypothetical protein